MKNVYLTGDPDSFIDQFMTLNMKYTDAPPDFLLGSALSCLGMAGSKLRLVLSSTSHSGLGLNQYYLLIGPSVTSRKSVSMTCALRVIWASQSLRERVVGDATAAGLIDFMDDHQPGPILLHRDEIHDVFRSVSEVYTSFQLNSILLEMYKRPSYRYNRTKKRSGKTKYDDVMVINDVYLSVLGGATPALYGDLTSRVLENGLIGRFLILSCEDQGPVKMPTLLDLEEKTRWQIEEQMLAARLDSIYEKLDRIQFVKMTESVLGILNRFQTEVLRHEKRYPTISSCFARVGTEAVYRTAALAALSRKGADPRDLWVSEDDAVVATKWCRRWMLNAMTLGSRIDKTANMKTAEHALTSAVGLCVNGSKVINRAELMQVTRLTSRELKDVEETLRLMGLITVKMKEREPGKAGRPVVQWEILGESLISPNQRPVPKIVYEDAPPYPDDGDPGSFQPF